ncbi:MAG: TlpA family protein disulfide reductase [Acidobacteriota bacterium]|nr:TlpA family protein disulfide reductase [Acidobacteriota bacterium]
MKRILSAFAMTALLAFGQGPAVPRKATDIGIQVDQGKYIWLSQYSGKTRLVAFLSTTCPHCQFTVGVLNKIAKDYEGKDVQFLASAINPMSSLYLPEFKQKFGPVFPIGYNDQSYVAKFLGFPPNDPMFVPQLVFVDKAGTIRAQFGGEDERMKNDLQEKSLREVLERTIKGLTTPATPMK